MLDISVRIGYYVLTMNNHSMHYQVEGLYYTRVNSNVLTVLNINYYSKY